MYYKYQPDINNSDYYNNDLAHLTDGTITIENIYDDYPFTDANGDSVDDYITIAENSETHTESTIIQKVTVAEKNEPLDSEWPGYRRIDIKVSAPDPNGKVKEQYLRLRTGKATLSRTIQYILRSKYEMIVDCTPKVQSIIEQPVEIDIKLPKGLTSTMFPLTLNIEVVNMSLSPDVSKPKNSLPVEVGTSPETGKPTFYFVKTIETKAEYDSLPDDESKNYEVLKTYWVTNIADSASEIKVTNYYFVDGEASFGNGVLFSDVKVNTDGQLFRGVGTPTRISFKLKEALSETDEDVTVILNGLKDEEGQTTLDVRPEGLTYEVDVTTATVDGDVSFTVEHPNYITASSQVVTRKSGRFTDLKVGGDATAVPYGAAPTSISFKLDNDDPNPSSRLIKVSYSGLIDSEEEGDPYSQIIDLSNLSDYVSLSEDKVVTITNLLVSTDDKNIQFTVEELNGVYDKITSGIFTRRLRKFESVSLSPTTLAGDAGLPVTLSFSGAELIDGMTVTLELDGLAPKAGTLSTKATTEYTYTVSGTGKQTVELETTESTTSSRTCSVKLKAAGFEDSEEVTVTQSAGITTTISNMTITLSVTGWSAPNNQNMKGYFSMVASENGVMSYSNNNVTVSSNSNGYGNNKVTTYTIQVTNIAIQNASNSCNITISCKNGNTTYGSKTIGINDLISNPNPSVALNLNPPLR